MNSTSMALKSLNGSDHCVLDTRVAQLVFPALYTVLFFWGALFNSLALWVFLHIRSSSTFIVYLKNTLVADLVLTLMLPFKILSDAHLGPWQIRVFVCRFSAIVFYETMYVGIILLGLIAFDRFLKIFRPFGKFFVQRPVFAKTVSALVWLLLFSLSLPNIILTNQKVTPSPVIQCASLKSTLGLWWHQLVNDISQGIFWTVLVLMLLFYTVIAKKVYNSYRRSKGTENKNNKRLEGKVFVVVAVFCVCFAPLHFVKVPYTHSQTNNSTDCGLQNRLFIAKESTLFLATMNICMDPLIYIFLCRKFTERLPCVKRSRSTASGQKIQSTQIYSVTLS